MRPRYSLLRFRGYMLAIEDDGQSIWLNTEVQRFDGLCIGSGADFPSALDDGIDTLRRALRSMERIKARAGERKRPTRAYYETP